MGAPAQLTHCIPVRAKLSSGCDGSGLRVATMDAAARPGGKRAATAGAPLAGLLSTTREPTRAMPLGSFSVARRNLAEI
jgi:hypothetical protein